MLKSLVMLIIFTATLIISCSLLAIFSFVKKEPSLGFFLLIPVLLPFIKILCVKSIELRELFYIFRIIELSFYLLLGYLILMKLRRLKQDPIKGEVKN
jgi:hypothetical protein